MRKFHRARLPDHSALLSGQLPSDAVSFLSTDLQIWFNTEEKSWLAEPEKQHLHTKSDEVFLVLKGALIVEVDGERHRIGPREFCCFPMGMLHAIVDVEAPLESLMIRAPSASDKIYKDA
jgi:mannose-6-phosphate isomerase-like protein (cupin superfamily)